MSHMIELTDEQFQTLARAAESAGATPDALLARLIASLRNPLKEPRAYQTTDWLRHLGLSDEDLCEIAREAEIDADADA
ncbi:MAG TPA: hypothetical protein VFU60_13550 [Ktedonobacterales bacterium]|jgi:hypothetical protein|nr:hypothetical protein [Ktedonobacterales bacterium]